MNLFMQGADGAPQDLPGGDPHIITGPMGDCVSVIILFNYNAVNNQYANGRGWHGQGGSQVIDMVAMMNGVPNLAITQVIIIPGSLQQSNYAYQQNMAHVQAGLGAHGNVNVRYVPNLTNATIDRHGIVN